MESPEARIKRLMMRSMRRGIKEMDLILHDFARRHLTTMTAAEIAAYDALLEENDHDLYHWVSGQGAAPARFAVLVARIAAGARGISGTPSVER